jgi:hypothetical protein
MIVETRDMAIFVHCCGYICDVGSHSFISRRLLEPCLFGYLSPMGSL